MRSIITPALLAGLLISTAEAQERSQDSVSHYLAALVGDITGQVSLDGPYITFVDWSTGNLAVHEIATGENRHLTRKGTWLDSDEFALYPRISFDGRTVAYAWYNEQEFYELRVVGIDGSGERILYRDEDVAYLQAKDWSPDGERVLVSLRPHDAPHQLAWISLADGELQVLKSFPDHSPGEVRCSPDGRYLAYDYPSTDGANARDIFLVDTDGGEETVLVAHPGEDRLLDWTPDGQRLLFTSERTGAPATWIVQVVDGGPLGEPQLVYPDAPGRGLGFTRAGAYYYCCGPPDLLSANEVFLVDRDPVTGRLGTAEKTDAEGIMSASSVAWSPDGRQLVYAKWRMVFVLHSLESGEEREISSGIYRPFPLYPQWTPAGRSLIAQGRRGLYRIDIESEEVDAILEVEDCCIGLSIWAPTAKVFFTRWKSEKRGEQVRLVVRDLESGGEKELHRVTSPVSISNLSLSPDGRWLAFVEWDMEGGGASLKRMPAGGGEAQSLLAFSQVRIFRRPLVELTWTPDSRHIVYAVSLTSQPWSPGQEIYQLPWETAGEHGFEFWQIPVEGGEPEPLGLRMETLVPYGLSIAPDGRRLAFTAGPRSGFYDPIAALENFLPPLKAEK
ncbi:MAG: hypothetical protein GTO61_12200 [Gemmatimonadales bacterium]|nr:hypothetical protein [Gemmatimonadales bacterium]